MLSLLLLLLACNNDAAEAPATPAPALPSAPAAAAEAPTANGHGGGDHGHGATHGGIQKELAGMHVEALVMPGAVMFYLSDGDAKPLPVDGFSGTAVVKGPAGVETVSLAPMGDHLHAVAKLEQGKPATVVLTLTKGASAQSATYDVASVGLAAHDHTSLHGGQVSMSGEVHVEYVVRDGAYQFWISDTHRVAIQDGVSGSVKDGETTVPLTFDAATGLLSGKGERAGSRPVMLEAAVAGKPFSLAFNAEKSAESGQSHGEPGHGHGEGQGAHDH